MVFLRRIETEEPEVLAVAAVEVVAVASVLAAQALLVRATTAGLVIFLDLVEAVAVVDNIAQARMQLVALPAVMVEKE